MKRAAPMLSRFPNSRWKHLVRLVPLGAVVGLVFGYLFQDLLYGLFVGCVFGFLLGLMFAARNPT